MSLNYSYHRYEAQVCQVWVLHCEVQNLSTPNLMNKQIILNSVYNQQ